MSEKREIMCDGVTFWADWYKGARSLPDADRLRQYDWFFGYAFEGVEPDEPGEDASREDRFAYQVFQLQKRSLEMSRIRAKAGRDGGKASGKSRKQSGSKREADAEVDAEANAKQSGSQMNHLKSKILNLDQEPLAPARGKKTPTVEQFVEGGKIAGVPEEYARQLFDELVQAGWEDRHGERIGNWRTYLKTAYNDAQKKEAARAVESASSGRYVELEA